MRRSTRVGCETSDPGGGKRHLRGRDSNVPSVEALFRNGDSNSS